MDAWDKRFAKMTVNYLELSILKCQGVFKGIQSFFFSFFLKKKNSGLTCKKSINYGFGGSIVGNVIGIASGCVIRHVVTGSNAMLRL